MLTNLADGENSFSHPSLSLCVSVCLSVRLSVSLSLCLSVCFSMCLCLCLSVCLSLEIVLADLAMRSDSFDHSSCLPVSESVSVSPLPLPSLFSPRSLFPLSLSPRSLSPLSLSPNSLSPLSLEIILAEFAMRFEAFFYI